MSDPSPEELERYRLRLEQLRDELIEHLRTSEASAKPVDLADPIGRLSRVDAMQAQQLARSQRRREELQLQMIGAALARIRGGTYGACISCEEQIPRGRLNAAPESPLCVPCRREGGG